MGCSTYAMTQNRSLTGLPPERGAFLACSFWLADNMLGHSTGQVLWPAGVPAGLNAQDFAQDFAHQCTAQN